MEVNPELVDKLAQLSRLSFSSEEKEAIRGDLQQMIQYIDKLKEIDTTGVEPLLFMTEATGVLRQDEVQGSVSRQAAMQNASNTDGEFFRVPKVLKR